MCKRLFMELLATLKFYVMVNLIALVPIFYGEGEMESFPGGMRFLPGQVQVSGVRILLNRPIPPKGRVETGGYVSFHARESRSFRAYRQVAYYDVWEGADLIFTPREDGSLEMQILLKPGASPEAIALSFNPPPRYDRGILKVGPLTLGNFHAYQGSDEVEVYPVIDGNTLRFHVPDYDPARPLVIDPDLGAVPLARLFGGSGDDWPSNADVMEVAPDGTIYVAGYTYSGDFDFGSASGYDTEGDTLWGDLFILRLNSSLQILSATYVGLPDEEDLGSDWISHIGPALAVDSSGNVFIAFGHRDFPVPPGGYQDTSSSNLTRDVVILKLDPDLTTITAGTYFGGTNTDWTLGDDDPLRMEVTPSGKVVVVGRTESDNLPASGGAVPTPPSPDSSNGFVAIFSNDLSTLLGCTYFGTSMNDFNNVERWVGLAVSPSEEIYVSFTAKSGDLPVVGGRPYAGGPSDIYVVKFSSDLSTVLASTYLGGSSLDGWTFNVTVPMKIDGDGNLVLASTTHSNDFPVVGGYDNTLGGGLDAVVVKLSSDLSTILASTYLGGDTTTNTSCFITGFSEAPADLEIDDNGFIYVGGGLCYVPNFPTSPSAYDRDWGGDQDGFVAKLYPDLNLLRASTYYAWPGHQEITSLELLPDGRLIVLGFADSNAVSGFPWEGFSGSPYGGADIFLAIFENSTGVSEKTVVSDEEVRLTPEGFVVKLSRSAYVGWDLYSYDGRRTEGGTLGFVPAGEYRVVLKEAVRGVYLLKLRVGKKVYVRKLLR